MREIQDAVNNGNYERADILLQRYIDSGKYYNDTTAILDAAICEHYGDRKGVWEAVQKGLRCNCRNYELYIMLGNYYLPENLYQACLCYENAWFHCDNPEDRVIIAGMLNQFKKKYGISVSKVAIIILSYDLLEYTQACIESIRRTTSEKQREIIVIDNGSKDGSVEWLREQSDIILVENKENKGFPGGCNQGIEVSSEESDIFLLNNDTILPENALFWLRMGLYGSEENGAAGSVSNFAGGQVVVSGADNVSDMIRFGEQNNIPMCCPYENRLFLVGFALLVKRSVIKQVGLLDERFFPGNNEDVDLGLRILKAGYQNVLCKNSFVLHFGSKTFNKDMERYYATAGRNRKKINEKWGFDVDHYLYPRSDLVKHMEGLEENVIRVLDVGCGCGATMAYIKGLYPRAETYGMESFSKASKFASHFGMVICGDLESMDIPWTEDYFDCILLGDVLGQMIDPEKILKKFKRYLKKEGYIIGSVSNVKHYSVILPLLQWDIFPYGETEILNNNCVKLYTGVEVRRLMMRSGYEIEVLDGTVSGNPGGQEERLLDGLQAVMKIPSKETFLVNQYVFKARKTECSL